MGCLKVQFQIEIYLKYFYVTYMLFMIITVDIASYDDDNIPLIQEKTNVNQKKKLQKIADKLFKRLHENERKN